jgi:hypothetical protein
VGAQGHAEGKSYITLVSELVGIVETPRHLRDACSRRLPGEKAQFQSAYQRWRARHAELFARIDAQVARATARAKREGSTWTLADFGEAGSELMHERLRAVTLEEARRVCAQYDGFLEDEDAAMESTVPKRLAVIEEADRELASREAQQ